MLFVTIGGATGENYSNEENIHYIFIGFFLFM